MPRNLSLAISQRSLPWLALLCSAVQFPYRVLKDGLLPRLLVLASEPGPLPVRVQTLLTISQASAAESIGSEFVSSNHWLLFEALIVS